MDTSLIIDTAALHRRIPIWNLKVIGLPFDREHLENENLWGNNSIAEGTYISYKTTRKDYIPGTSTLVDNWIAEFEKTNDIIQIVSELLQKEENINHMLTLFPLEGKGEVDIEKFLRKNCSVFTKIMKDEPGFSMNKHFDNRSVFGNIFFNLTDNDNVSTTFYRGINTPDQDLTFDSDDSFYKCSTKKAEGTLFLNTDTTFHTIEHNSDINRYVVNTVLYFTNLANI